MIIDRQRQRIIEQELLRLLLNGSVPSNREVVARTDYLLSKLTGTFFNYYPIQKRSDFDLSSFNQHLSSIKLDLDVLYEELFDQLKTLLSRLSYYEATSAQYATHLKQLTSTIDALLFSSNQADDSFTAVFDDCTSLSKLSQPDSTPGIIDLQEGCITLPFSEGGLQVWASPALMQDEGLTIVTPVGNYLRAGLVGGAHNRNLFNSSISAWQYEIVKINSLPTKVTIEFPLDGLNFSEVELTRLVINPLSEGQEVSIAYSLDRLNWKSLGSGWIMDFEPTIMRYLLIELSKTIPDAEVNDTEFRFIFGLKSINFYSTGRVSSGIYQSAGFNVGQAINAVKLEALEDIPVGCKADFSVAIGDSTGPTTSYLGINPSNRADSAIPKLLQFNQAYSQEEVFNGVAGTLYSTYRNIPFYTVGTLSSTPIFKSAQLYHGFQGWWRDTTGRSNIVEVRDNQVDFTSANTQPLYTSYQELPVFTYKDLGDGLFDVTLSTKYPVLYPAGWDLTPGETGSIFYAVAKVEQIYANDYVSFSFTYDRGAAENPNKINFNDPVVNLVSTNFLLTGDNKLSLTAEVSGRTVKFIEGVDYIIDTELVQGISRPLGTLTIPTNSKLVDYASITLTVEYWLNPTISHKISGINGNTVTLSAVKFDPTKDGILINYRYSPTNILSSTVKVTKAERQFSEGLDWTLDVTSGKITRVPTGNIKATDQVTVNYMIKAVADGVTQFHTWVYNGASNYVRLQFFSGLAPDKRVGEGFYLSLPAGIIDLTNATETPPIPPGWVQFTVNSKVPEYNYDSALIHQVAKLKTRQGQVIFQHAGAVFSKMVATRTPLAQVPLSHLMKGTLRLDHSVFAIGPNNEVIINFAPTNVDEIYFVRADSNALFPEITTEDFQVVYHSVTEDSENSWLYLKILLTRDQNVHRALAPKVFRWVAKVF